MYYNLFLQNLKFSITNIGLKCKFYKLYVLQYICKPNKILFINFLNPEYINYQQIIKIEIQLFKQ